MHPPDPEVELHQKVQRIVEPPECLDVVGNPVDREYVNPHADIFPHPRYAAGCQRPFSVADTSECDVAVGGVPAVKKCVLV